MKRFLLETVAEMALWVMCSAPIAMVASALKDVGFSDAFGWAMLGLFAVNTGRQFIAGVDLIRGKR